MTETSASQDKVFFSYSRHDLAFVERVVRALRERGIEVWRDTDDIPGGAAWTRRIESALEATRRTVVVLSPSAVESDYVQDEIVRARELKHLLIPLLYQDCKTPLVLAGRQHIDFRESNDFDEGLERLVRALTPEAGQPSEGTGSASRLPPGRSRRRTGYILASIFALVLGSVFAWTLVQKQEVGFDRLFNLKRYAEAESLQPPARWEAGSKQQPIPERAFIAGYEQVRKLPLCRAVYEGRTYAGKVVEGRCNIPVGDEEVQRGEFDYLVLPGENLSWRPVTTGNIPGGIVPFSASSASQRDRVLVCKASYREGDHPGTLVREGCSISYGRSSRVMATYDILVSKED